MNLFSQNLRVLALISLTVLAGGYLYERYLDITMDSDPIPTAERAILTPLGSSVSMSSLLDLTVFKGVSEVTELNDGTRVITSLLGGAKITHDREVITFLGSNTNIYFSLSPDRRVSRIELIAGEIWAELGRSLTEKEAYVIYTPTMVITTEDASFRVLVGESQSVSVRQGVAVVSQRSNATGEAVPGSEVIIKSGQILRSLATGFEVQNATPEDLAAWYLEYVSTYIVDTPAAENVNFNFLTD